MKETENFNVITMPEPETIEAKLPEWYKEIISHSNKEYSHEEARSRFFGTSKYWQAFPDSLHYLTDGASYTLFRHTPALLALICSVDTTLMLAKSLLSDYGVPYRTIYKISMSGELRAFADDDDKEMIKLHLLGEATRDKFSSHFENLTMVHELEFFVYGPTEKRIVIIPTEN